MLPTYFSHQRIGRDDCAGDNGGDKFCASCCFIFSNNIPNVLTRICHRQNARRPAEMESANHESKTGKSAFRYVPRRVNPARAPRVRPGLMLNGDAVELTARNRDERGGCVVAARGNGTLEQKGIPPAIRRHTARDHGNRQRAQCKFCANVGHLEYLVSQASIASLAQFEKTRKNPPGCQPPTLSISIRCRASSADFPGGA